MVKKLITVLLILFCGNTFSQLKTNSDFIISKGRFYSAFNFSLNQRKAENENQLLRQVIYQDRYNYRAIGNAGYAIKDNMTLGLSLGYGRLKENITYLDENNENVTTDR